MYLLCGWDWLWNNRRSSGIIGPYAARRDFGVHVALNSFSWNGWAVKDIGRCIWEEMRADDVFGRAAQLAYYFFLALFPFLICVIASLSVFGSADRGRALLLEFFAHSLPTPAFQLISTTISEIIRSSGPLKMSFGLIASLWSASLGMGAIMDTLNAAYKLAETRSLITQYAVAIGLTFAMGVLMIVFILAVITGNSLAGSLSAGNLLVITWKIAKWSFGLVFLLIAFAILFHFAPDLRNRRWRWVTPGGIVGLLLLSGISIGLRVYFRFLGTYNAAYGSLGAVIILLLCFYMTGIAVLSGGVLNAVLERRATALPRQELD
jgi:membrane protein